MNRALLIAAALLLQSGVAFADAYPQKAVKLVVPFAAGGAVDQGARLIAEGLSQRWDQPVVVENRPGAGTEIGSAHVAKAPADGYTILYQSASFTNLPAVKKSLSIDMSTDFVPVASTGIGIVGVAVGPGVKAKTFEEFVGETKSRSVFFAANGVGSAGHLLSESVNLAAGTNMRAVQFGSGSESVTDVAGGRTDAYISSMPAMVPMIEAGKLRLLAVLGKERAKAFPDVPTLSELGYDKVDNASAWWGVFVPAGTPDDVVAKINKTVHEVAQTEEYQRFLTNGIATYRHMSPAEYAEFTRSEFKFWQSVVSERGITVD